MKKLNRHQQSPLQLEPLERREMLTAEFIGHFDFGANVLESGDETILITPSGPITDLSWSIWRLDDYGMKQLTPESFDYIDRETVTAANQLFFFPRTAEGREVWVTDGTEDGTRRVFNPAGAARVRASFSVALDDKLYFPQRNELWVTDGTAEGTHVVIDMDPSRQPSGISDLNAFQESIFFTIWRSNQTELWQSDGTAEGTRMVRSIPTEDNDSQLSVQDDHLLLSHGDGRWISDGTAEGTVQLPDSNKNGIHVGQNVFRLQFPTDDNGYALWVETDSGRQLLKTDVIVRSWCGFEFQHAALGESLLFPAKDENGNPGLWKSDGTVAGTELVKDTSLIPARIVNDELLLWGRDDEAGIQLWKTDGTTEGTMRMTDMNSGPESSFALNNRGWVVSGLHVVHDYLYFTTGRPAGRVLGIVPGNGMNLWRLSLTENVRVKTGDANRDGVFNQLDLVHVLQAAKYDTREPATFSEGDWNGDGVFDQLDIVAALQTGNYLQGSYAAMVVDAAFIDSN